jgi:hypothetical protein
MTQANKAMRVGGAWLAIASFLMILALALHGPIAPDPGDQMARIAEAAVRWSVAHWIAAAGLSLYAVTGLVVLTSQSRLTEGWWTMTAWAVIPVGALWTMTTAVAETTVVASAAASGSSETFQAWWAFAEGKAHGYAFVALALAVIAGNEARSSAGATPAWSAWAAMLAGIASFAGWVLGMWFGIGLGSPLWVASSIVMSVWALWFGVALTRSPH